MTFKIYLEAMKVRNFVPSSSTFGDVHVGHSHVELEAMIRRLWGCTWRPYPGELGGHD